MFLLEQARAQGKFESKDSKRSILASRNERESTIHGYVLQSYAIVQEVLSTTVFLAPLQFSFDTSTNLGGTARQTFVVAVSGNNAEIDLGDFELESRRYQNTRYNVSNRMSFDSQPGQNFE